MSDMERLVEFLLREIADDEALALKSSKTDLSRWAHYLLWARFSPARVLAECAAKKAIVELHAPESEGMGYLGGGEYGGIDPACSTCGYAEEYGVPWPCQTLRLLAQPYADRPGFDPAWKVET